jgi:hypothetical protein
VTACACEKARFANKRLRLVCPAYSEMFCHVVLLPAGHYRVPPALGEQTESKRSTLPRAVFGTSTRDDAVPKVWQIQLGTVTWCCSARLAQPPQPARQLELQRAHLGAPCTLVMHALRSGCDVKVHVSLFVCPAVPVSAPRRLSAPRCPGPPGGQHQGVSTRHQDRHQLKGSGL